MNRLAEREARAAAIAQFAPGRQGAPLDAAAPIHFATSLDQYRQFALASLRNSPIESGASVRPHAAL